MASPAAVLATLMRAASTVHCDYEAHIKAVAAAHVAMDEYRSQALAETGTPARAEYEHARATILLPALKVFFAFYDADVAREAARLRQDTH